MAYVLRSAQLVKMDRPSIQFVILDVKSRIVNMTSLTVLYRLSKVSYGTSSFPTVLSRKRTEEIIQLDDRSRRERYAFSKTEDQKDEGSGKAKWSFGSYSMLVIPATTFCLGCWQTYRLRWKLDLIEKLKGRLNEPAVDFPLDDVSKLDTMEYRRVRITGEFLHEREFYISPRGRFDPGYVEQRQGSIFSTDSLSSHGAHIITPFRLSNSNLIVMVNRGWVPASMISQSSRQSSQPEGIITLDAIVRKSETRPQFISKNMPERGQWFYKDFFEMARYYNTDPIYLEAVYDSTIDGGPIGGQTNVSVRNDHLSYLLTWFSLSVVTFAMWIIRFRK